MDSVKQLNLQKQLNKFNVKYDWIWLILWVSSITSLMFAVAGHITTISPSFSTLLHLNVWLLIVLAAINIITLKATPEATTLLKTFTQNQLRNTQDIYANSLIMVLALYISHLPHN